jgi:hypothetical protein
MAPSNSAARFKPTLSVPNPPLIFFSASVPVIDTDVWALGFPILAPVAGGTVGKKRGRREDALNHGGIATRRRGVAAQQPSFPQEIPRGEEQKGWRRRA